jgi:hypothetical protein
VKKQVNFDLMAAEGFKWAKKLSGTFFEKEFQQKL